MRLALLAGCAGLVLGWGLRGAHETYWFALPAWLRGADESRFLLNGRRAG